MKLKNKLLPLVGVSAVCATVAPIALTSCKNGNLVDLTQRYQSKYTDIPAHDTWDVKDANDRYFGLLANEIDRVADELYWSQSMINVDLFGSLSEYLTITRDNEKLENVSLKKVEYTPSNNETIRQWVISYDRTIEYTAVYEDDDDVSTITADGKISMKNMPVVLNFNGSFWNVTTWFQNLNDIFNDEEAAEAFETSVSIDAKYTVAEEEKSSAGTGSTFRDYFYQTTIEDMESWVEWKKWEQSEGDDPLRGGASMIGYSFLYGQWYSHYLFNIIGA